MNKYTTFTELEKLTNKERLELKKECENGRTCYLADIEEFLEDVVNDKGELKLLKEAFE